ncbi:MAG: PKD domain-containing protein, partial [Proteobacteria bacterium]|nr:PKD domain-containing protein [Pseudomonadota bacterium]
YTVSLTLMDSYGYYTKTEDNYIQVLAPPAGVVKFAGAPQNGSPGTEVHFINLTPGFTAEGCKFLWDFGDGTSSTEEDPSHIYTHCGTFDVSLTLWNSYGYYTKTEDNYITISPSGFEFTWAPQTGIAGTDVQFINLTPGEFDKFLWDFGDGSGSNLPDPAHPYVAAGTYTVTLTLMDSAGYYYTRTKLITIE